MPRSHWKLHLDVNRQEAAEAILGKCVIAFDRPPIESKLEAYAKGGYMAVLEFFHNDDLSWQEQVFEVLLFAQKFGGRLVVAGQRARRPLWSAKQRCRGKNLNRWCELGRVAAVQ